MDVFNRITGRTGPLPDGMPFSKLFSLGHIDRRIQSHLVNVYSTLATCLLIAAAGCYVDMTTRVGGALTGALAFGALAALLLMAPTPQNQGKRYAALATCGGGDFDVVKHSLDLFLDVISLFVRIVVILLRSAEKREDEGRRGRRGRRGRDE
ncbi:bax inhibitor [Raphidocelis subcapitata]|uniref:Bax inhibitor n=1 Tax=Raphidocelis subcapitata TaxID=307507 RepID=A0A2V0P8P8_9CHLO|nr:bax inhibitor [Raphidocelis subcapitata]|eukprot:GBF96241.1 bax inhibitor [Raphidocelis subcapitata]